VLIDRRHRYATVSSITRISSLRDLISLIEPGI
jgi:hypothetical protein